MILGNFQHASESVRCTSGVAILHLYLIGTNVCRVLRLCFVTLSETTQAFSWVTGVLATHEAPKYLSDWTQKRKKAKLSGASVVGLEKQLSTSVGEIPVVLKWAASSGRTDVVRNILETSNKRTKLMPGTSGHALLLAIQNGHTEAANLLINRGEGMTYADENSATLLHWAARIGQSSICQKLLGKGVSLGAKDDDGQTALDWAMKGNHELTINMLLKGGKNVTRQKTANLQSLHLSARTGDIAMIRDFHKQGSSLEARDGKGQTVLFHAVKGKQHHIVKWLTEEGQANVQAVDKEGLTALHVAAQGCDLKSAEILLERNAGVNAMSSRNLTPLHCIPHSEGVGVLRLLHEKGATPMPHAIVSSVNDRPSESTTL
jgi:ankyrin repeat protein